MAQFKSTAELVDQLRRASMSIPLNIAESAGRTGTDDRARFYGIARGSAMECSALLDVCRIQRGYDEDKIKAGKTLLLRIVEMLTKIADFYDQQVKTSVKALTSLIEPLMIGVMGFLVGGMVMAIFLPIFKMVGSLSGKG